MPGAPSLNVDLFDEKLRELIEAKSNVSRHSLRYALGQVQDYARHVNHEQLAVLVPKKPPVDLVDLLNSYGITCIYEVSSGDFERIEAGS
ncbi:hypothetical protein [Saccharopolyspora sp. NPDC049357]|uniref:hypothetical protein n=1 Tax=Saccharopolyspora sp. NPDC049357 TaxID=3154507 RepID=UPI00342497B6